MTELKRTNSFDDNPQHVTEPVNQTSQLESKCSQVSDFKKKLCENAENDVYQFFPNKILEMEKLVKSELFEQGPSAVHCELPVVTSNGPPVNENSEDHPVTKKRKLDDIAMSLCSNDFKTNTTEHYPCNQKILEVIKILKPHIITLVEKCSALKLWIELKIPKIEDGNNFGVSIQEDILGEVSKLEGDAGSYLEQITRYYTTRGKMMSKFLKYPQLDDYRKAIEEYDEKIYFSLKLICVELRNTYCILHDLISKNIEKLKRPRSTNTDSMY